MASLQVERAPISTEDLKQPQISAQARIRNITGSDMKLSRSISWFGTPTGGSFPDAIPANDLVRIDHLRGNDPSCKGAVVYAGRNRAGTPCSWVLAWDAPACTSVSPNKVYMMCGLTSDIEKIDFTQIQANLDKSGAEVKPSDPVSNTSAHGIINHFMPNSAYIVAYFVSLEP